MDIGPEGGAREEHRRGLVVGEGAYVHVSRYRCESRFVFSPVATCCARVSRPIGLAPDLPKALVAGSVQVTRCGRE